ncbi:hypothetical protein BGZ83_009622 [Gryganskiella cystojenkinii]|nr:hypothetical protein BGZ83_009622 [Gryganskiella cystojenkinii]
MKNSSSSSTLSSRKRRQKEEREERADQELLESQNREWEEAVAAADEYEYQQILEDVRIDSKRMADLNANWVPTTRTCVKHHVQDQPIPSEYSPMGQSEATLLRKFEQQRRQIKKLKVELRMCDGHKKRRYAPYDHRLSRSHEHRRRSGKKLTDDERRAVLHCHEMCRQEHARPFISIQRTAHYLGMAVKTVQEVLSGIKTRDKRGRYIRTLRSKDFEPYILNLATEWNLEGTPVTLKRSVRVYVITGAAHIKYLQLRRFAGICTGWALDTTERTRQKIMSTLPTSGLNDVIICENGTQTSLRMLFFKKMTVLRKNKGRRWCIIYAGSEEGWMGEPWVWEADNRSADYHENMNATMFEKYMTALCEWCKTHYPGREIVFCMDNAKYHRREYQAQAQPTEEAAAPEEPIRTVEDYLRLKVNKGKVKGKSKDKGKNEGEGEGEGKDKGKGKGKVSQKVENVAPQKSLSQMNKGELVLRLARILGTLFAPLREDVFATQLKGYTKPVLYEMARKPEFVLPLTTEVIAQEYGYRVLWLPPYHPDINPIEEAWGIAKGHVSLENNGSKPFLQVKQLLLEGFEKVDWRPLVRRAQKHEREYMKQYQVTLEDEGEFEIDIDEDEEEEDTDEEDTEDEEDE